MDGRYGQIELRIKLKDGSTFIKDADWHFFGSKNSSVFWLKTENKHFKEGLMQGYRHTRIPLDIIVKIEKHYGKGNVWITLWEAKKDE
jgi:hypothetical protein